MTTNARFSDDKHENEPTYVDYLKRAITETISGITDEKKLNYIHTMVMNAVIAETQQEGC